MFVVAATKIIYSSFPIKIMYSQSNMRTDKENYYQELKNICFPVSLQMRLYNYDHPQNSV